MQFTALVELINISSRSPCNERSFLSLPRSPLPVSPLSLFLSLAPSIATAPSDEFETWNKKFKSRRLLSARGIAACKNDPGTRPSNFYEVIYKLCMYHVHARSWHNCARFVCTYVGTLDITNVIPSLDRHFSNKRCVQIFAAIYFVL